MMQENCLSKGIWDQPATTQWNTLLQPKTLSWSHQVLAYNEKAKAEFYSSTTKQTRTILDDTIKI